LARRIDFYCDPPGKAANTGLMKREDAALIVLMADDDEDDCLLVESAFQEISIADNLRFVCTRRQFHIPSGRVTRTALLRINAGGKRGD
jgi:hypothetical protein